MSKKFTIWLVYPFPLFKFHISSELFCKLVTLLGIFTIKNCLENWLSGWIIKLIKIEEIYVFFLIILLFNNLNLDNYYKNLLWYLIFGIYYKKSIDKKNYYNLWNE